MEDDSGQEGVSEQLKLRRIRSPPCKECGWRWGRGFREREGMCKGPEAGSTCMLQEFTEDQCD